MPSPAASREPPAERSGERSREHGYITVWVLGLVVILLFFGGISLDLWRVYTAHQDLVNAADSAAIAGASGINVAVFRQSGQVVLDPGRASAMAHANLVDNQQVNRDWLVGPPQISVATNPAPGTVTVRIEARVGFTLLKILLPPSNHSLTMVVQESASPEASG